MSAQHPGNVARRDERAGHVSLAQRLRFSRWLPIVPLVLMLAAFGLHVLGREGVSFALVGLAAPFSILAFSFGPLRSPTRSEPFDEREQLLLARARLAGANASIFLAIGSGLVFWLG